MPTLHIPSCLSPDQHADPCAVAPSPSLPLVQHAYPLAQVPPTSGVAVSPEFATPARPAGAMTDGAITALAFVDRGDMLAVADAQGFVYVWALDADVQVWTPTRRARVWGGSCGRRGGGRRPRGRAWHAVVCMRS
eukprot:365471-Chlamydomonas_euryale.AAC.29